MVSWCPFNGTRRISSGQKGLIPLSFEVQEVDLMRKPLGLCSGGVSLFNTYIGRGS
jgi:hypothetical protein